MPTDLLIVGAGGHAKVVVESILAGARDYRLLVVDQNKSVVGSHLLPEIEIRPVPDDRELPKLAHIAVGDNRLRCRIAADLKNAGCQLVTVIHPRAQVSEYASLRPGCFVAANAVIAAMVAIGENCIINHGAIVDHDCKIGSNTHVAPNATIGGGVEIDEMCLIGSGSTILPGQKIARNATIGSGAVVKTHVMRDMVMVGVPAKPLRNHEED